MHSLSFICERGKDRKGKGNSPSLFCVFGSVCHSTKGTALLFQEEKGRSFPSFGFFWKGNSLLSAYCSRKSDGAAAVAAKCSFGVPLYEEVCTNFENPPSDEGGVGRENLSP